MSTYLDAMTDDELLEAASLAVESNRRVRMAACDDLDAFIDATNRTLTKHFGPDHQRILGSAGRLVASFDW